MPRSTVVLGWVKLACPGFIPHAVAAFGIGCAEDNPPDSGPKRRAGAHWARFEGHIQRALIEVLAAKKFRRRRKGLRLRHGPKSFNRSQRLWARAITCPRATMTAPTGTSSCSKACWASARARRMKCSSFSGCSTGRSYVEATNSSSAFCARELASTREAPAGGEAGRIRVPWVQVAMPNATANARQVDLLGLTGRRDEDGAFAQCREGRQR